MRSFIRFFLGTALVLAGLAPAAAHAERVQAAVAANFVVTAQEIAQRFSAETGHTVEISAGSTGKFYAQIVNGAPFDLLLAADAAHPQRLEAEGFAVAGTRITYAVGRLVLWSAAPGLVDDQGAVLTRTTGKIAIVNPDVAPYGAAAIAAMRALGVLDAVQTRIVQGDSITQAYQFVATGNAELGFVALSQVIAQPNGSHWLVPLSLYPPLRQDGVVLRAGADNAAARAFLAYLKTDSAGAIIRRYGYEFD